jgi:hypothetical protein
MLDVPFSAVIEPAKGRAKTGRAAKTNRTANAIAARWAVVTALGFNTIVLGKPLLAYNGFIALRVDLVKFFELNSGWLKSLLP